MKIIYMISKRWLFLVLFYSVGFFAGLVYSFDATAQITQRERPQAWDSLAFGGRFMDRFLPIPVIGPLTEETWGAGNVIPRYVDNGIEDDEWSYWGGNVLWGDDGQYHLFVCRWPENSPKGHGEWPNSTVVHAVAGNPLGPYKVKAEIGKGHNPEAFRLKDGRYVIYVIDGYYIADDINGPWQSGQFEFDARGRRIIEGLSNLTFARREDGSYLMVCRGGGIWFSQTGVSPWYQVTGKSVYPPVEGRFEDPVVWRTNIQYHMIVNDWYGRIAYYLRSKDGIHWKVDPGEAYLPGIARYEDGTVVDWFKYERIKVLQDELGRATQANFAVIDVLKKEDRANDNHSSKNISIPLTVGRQIVMLDREKINEETKSIRVKIMAEEDFNPHVDLDINSLRFGASEEVNFGRGSKVMATKKSGDDLVVTFHGEGNGLSDDNFAAKLLGKTSDGKLLFGYARLPWVDYMEPALSARLPDFTNNEKGSFVNVEVQNFGQVASKPAVIKIEQTIDGEAVEVASGEVPALSPFQKTTVEMRAVQVLEPGSEDDVKVSFYGTPKPSETVVEAARNVLERVIGQQAHNIKLEVIPAADDHATYEYEAKNGQLTVRGSSPTAITRGVYDYLRAKGLGMLDWSGPHFDIPARWPDAEKTRVATPFRIRHAHNVVTSGYTTPYWDWERWEQELDWQAMHGFNMLMALVATEAIATRVWKRLGLTQSEIDAFYVGPAHLPWQRMGNICKVGGSLPPEWHTDQIALQHKLLKRMRELSIDPVIQSFAGFVPKAIKRLFPDVVLHNTLWNAGFPPEQRPVLLMPGDTLFASITKMYMEEWQKEFGEADYYLVDSFNELELPETDRPVTELLAEYGKQTYEAIRAGDTNATWVIQGWMFGYQRNIWNPERVEALFSRVPNDSVLILDYANDYANNWEPMNGFNGKQWAYGFVPNMGGKTAYTGDMSLYATGAAEVLASSHKNNLVGFSISGEGLENNTVLYELMADAAWSHQPIDLDDWLEKYNINRYGASNKVLMESWRLSRESCYSRLEPHPQFGWQLGQCKMGTVHNNPKFHEATLKFLSVADQLKDSENYRADAIEIASLSLGLKADEWFTAAAKAYAEGDMISGDRAGEQGLELLTQLDRLMASHPLNRLERWLNLTQKHGGDAQLKRFYESNARRIITVWGPPVNDYSCRVWSGLVRDFYRERMVQVLASLKAGQPFDKNAWEVKWVESSGISKVEPFDDPLGAAQGLVNVALSSL